jgi:hypothetical protein
MTIKTAPEIDRLFQGVASHLALTDKQVQQLTSLSVNHHLIPISRSCKSGTTTIQLTNGQYTVSADQTVFWQHIHAMGKIVAPQDGSEYSLVVQDGGKVIYSAQNIVVGQEVTFDYNPGLSVHTNITLTCTSDPQKTATLTVEGQACIG